MTNKAMELKNLIDGYQLTCSGSRSRAYEENSNMMATNPGCWLTY